MRTASTRRRVRTVDNCLTCQPRVAATYPEPEQMAECPDCWTSSGSGPDVGALGQTAPTMDALGFPILPGGGFMQGVTYRQDGGWTGPALAAYRSDFRRKFGRHGH